MSLLVSRTYAKLRRSGGLARHDLQVEAGEAVALVGDNGAGKSTLMKTITGVHRPTAGRIVFDGAARRR